MGEAIERHNVVLEAGDVNAVNELAKSKGLLSFSAALRMIIREWTDFRANDRVRITEAGRAALQESASQDQSKA